MRRFGGTDIKYLKGVGETRAKVLATEADIHTVRDLLYYFPFRYTDRSKFYLIRELGPDMPAVQIKGRFVKFVLEGEGARKRLIGIFSDGKNLMEVVWFASVARIREGLTVGKEYVLFGKPTSFRGAYQLAHPEVEVYDPSKPPQGFRGHYTVTDMMRKKMLTARTISSLVANALNHAQFQGIAETLPKEVIDRLHLMPIDEALRNIHFPKDAESLRRARERMKIEELFYIELHILRFSRERGVSVRGPVFDIVGEAFHKFYSDVLPFDLTGAQKRVIREIWNDMRSHHQMNRLLQGDVGCGKTMVAFMSMLIAIGNGHQAALMAPTEILAQQHLASLKPWCEALGIKISLLTGSVRTTARREIHEGLLNGEIGIIVGTHALIEDTVKFKRLGLVVIDEQHRFGVAQRARMWKKSEISPHVLVMTATPIPRTLAMTVYGDLEVSVIDELPPGRKPVTTWLRYDNNRTAVDRLIAHELKAGRRIYIVHPLIHDNPKLELKSVEEGYARICEDYPSYKVSLVHGQLSAAEKDHQMQMFVRGESRIMVATTVIEVGVNVPEASVMVIENAERFGLSQLHQLRGRVGRGADESYCILMSKPKIAAETRKRLEIMTQTTDGFLVAEADLKFRGPGDMEGTQQSGIAFNLKLANLATDGQLISIARTEASRILDLAPELSGLPRNVSSLTLSPHSLEIIHSELQFRFARTFDWSRIS